MVQLKADFQAGFLKPGYCTQLVCGSWLWNTNTCTTTHRLTGLVVKASASRAEDPGFESRLRRDFFGVESYR